jgi:outer membrane immunogenic protein
VLSSNYSSRITDNIVRVGLNYRFGGPVVAKY